MAKEFEASETSDGAPKKRRSRRNKAAARRQSRAAPRKAAREGRRRRPLPIPVRRSRKREIATECAGGPKGRLFFEGREEKERKEKKEKKGGERGNGGSGIGAEMLFRS